MDVIPQKNIHEAAEGLRALAHDIRLSVLCHLLQGPMCVRELMDVTGASQSNLSQHLAKMRLMGVLMNEKHGQRVFYRIANPAFEQLIKALKAIYCPDNCH